MNKTETQEEFLQRILRESQQHMKKVEEQKKLKEEQDKRIKATINAVDSTEKNYEEFKTEFKGVLNEILEKTAKSMGVKNIEYKHRPENVGSG